MVSTAIEPSETKAAPLAWDDFLAWARQENEYQKKIAGVHPADHPNPVLRGRTYFEVNLYRYYHCLCVCWPYLKTPRQKILDVGSWPGVWMRAIAHFFKDQQHEIWATGLLFPDDFLGKMGGACKGTMKCELDVWSPMAEREAPNILRERGFTFVTAMEVVEHLYHPGWFFKVIAEATEPGAHLVLTTNNAARLSNLIGFLAGDGLVGNLDELHPRGGGELGAWRPHAREYIWQELNHLAIKAGFAHVDHGFYQENYGLKLIEAEDLVNENVPLRTEKERRLVERMKPLLSEPDQLKSGMYLVMRK